MTKRHTLIEAKAKNLNYWKDIIDFKGLLYFLAWRDLLVRYKQTAFGLLWGVVRPALTIASMWFIGWLFHSRVPGSTPRILFVCCATLPWQFFSSAFTEISNSLLSNSNLLTKIYFPRLIIPVSTLVVAFIDFLIGLGLLLLIMLYYKYPITLHFFLFPVLLILAAFSALGAGLIIAVLNVKYRDFRFVVPFMLQVGLYASPIAFSSIDVLNNPSIPSFFKYLFSLNPMVGIIDGFRWSILNQNDSFNIQSITISFLVGIVLLLLGVWYFRKKESSFADII